MLFPHFYYKFYAKLKHLFKQCHNSLLGVPSPSKLSFSRWTKKNTNMTESFLEIQTNFDRNFLSKIFLDIFPALVCSHNLSYCYFLYLLFPIFKLYGESEVTAKKHRNITYIRTVKCCFLALCTVQHTFMPVFSSLIVITAKNYQAYFVVWLLKFNKILVFQCSCLNIIYMYICVIYIILFRISYLAAQ